jgi:NAD(P)-dependent dehydrogenase (short-subunit alcohol dehydrogenase family)
MTLDLKGKRVVVTGGKHAVERAIVEAVAQEGADVVIWLRKWDDDGNEAKVLSIAQLEIPSQQPNGASPHTSLMAPVNGATKILLVTSIPGIPVFTLLD